MLEKELKYNKINLKTPCFMRLSPFVFIIPYGHSTASYLLKLGFSMKEIQIWLGHSQISTTMDIYTHIDTQMKTNIGEKIEGTFKII